MTDLDSILSIKLAERDAKSQLRERLSLQSSQAHQVKIEDQSFLNFSSNDYLGLADSSETITAVKKQLDESGFGSGASHLVTGHHKIHDKLEVAVAEFLQRESAVTFSTGYMANLSILQSLAQKGDLIIADKLNHASLIDGVKLSDAQSSRYPHCDISVLETRLKKSAANKWVVTDSVFSMDGDIAPLDKIAGLCHKHKAYLIVDDAHGIGVLGQNGRGCVEHFGLSESELPILMGTFGKALGGFGAFVSGSEVLTSYLVQFARPYVYTTALPASVAAANLFNLERVINNPNKIAKLKQNIDYFKRQCKDKNIELLPSQTPIQPLWVGDSKKLITTNSKLKQAGILVGAIRPPTVPLNGDRLRITLTASHQFEQIDLLLEQLIKCS